jgi:uncharacterized delta-60 repeat protein
VLPPTAIAAKRYVEGGTFDTGFSGGAVATKIDPSEYEYALAAALQSGKIIAAGHSVLAGQGVIALVRYNADGSLDSAPGSFGSAGIVRTAVPLVNAVGTAVAVQGDGKILVAGSTFDPATGTTGIVLARYNTGGTLDASFAGGQGFVSAPIGPGTSTDNASLVLQGNGSIVVAGATSDGNFVLRRYDSAGVLDPLFGTTGTGGTTTIHVGTSAMGPAIALQSGKIVAAGASGSFASPPMKAVLVRYNTNGTLDLTFGGTGTGMVFTDTVPSSNNLANAVAVQTPGDKIVVAGHAFVDFAADTSDIILLRYNADGTLDSAPGSFGTNGVVVINLGAFDNVFSVALYPDPDNRIVVSGNTGSGVAISAAVLRFTPGGTLDPTFGTGGIVTTSPTGPSTAASANAVLVQPDRSVVVVGYD